MLATTELDSNGFSTVTHLSNTLTVDEDLGGTLASQREVLGGDVEGEALLGSLLGEAFVELDARTSELGVVYTRTLGREVSSLISLDHPVGVMLQGLALALVEHEREAGDHIVKDRAAVLASYGVHAGVMPAERGPDRRDGDEELAYHHSNDEMFDSKSITVEVHHVGVEGIVEAAVLIPETEESLLPLFEAVLMIVLLGQENGIGFEDDRSNLITRQFQMAEIGGAAVGRNLAINALPEAIDMASATLA